MKRLTGQIEYVYHGSPDTNNLPRYYWERTYRSTSCNNEIDRVENLWVNKEGELTQSSQLSLVVEYIQARESA